MSEEYVEESFVNLNFFSGFGYPKNDLSFILRNVGFAIHLGGGRGNVERTAEWLNGVNPDYIGAQEINQGNIPNCGYDQHRGFQDNLDMEYAYADRERTERSLINIANAMYCKTEPENWKIIPLSKEGVAERRALVVENRDHIVVTAHFSRFTRFGGDAKKKREKEIDELVENMPTHKPYVFLIDGNADVNGNCHRYLCDAIEGESVCEGPTHPSYKTIGKPKQRGHIIIPRNRSGIQVLESRICEDAKISDHHPLYFKAKFLRLS